MSKPTAKRTTVAQNKKARFDYHIEETFEAGLMLMGSEVKSLRQGKATITESYATEENGEIFLINAYIPEYSEANRFNHEPRRPRKLLLHKREINRLIGAVQKKGKTLVALSIYFNDSGYAKVELGLAVGKQKHDKRDTEKKRDWQRDKARIMKERG